MSPLLWGLFWFAVSVSLVILTLLWIGLCHTAGQETQSTAPAPVDRDAQGQARTKPCMVPFCEDPAQVVIPVGIGDKWSFCISHGLPYLREDAEA